MSSHHIIRENQEPALVIDDTWNENSESIQQLLEWSPTVIVTEHALESILSWGIKIDIVIALEQHVDELTKSLQDQFPLRILSCLTETETIETALHFLTDSGQKAVTIISTAALELFEKFSSLDIAVIQHGRRWVLIRNGHFEKWLPANTTLAIYPKDDAELSVEKDGLITIQRNYSFWISQLN